MRCLEIALLEFEVVKMAVMEARAGQDGLADGKRTEVSIGDNGIPVVELYTVGAAVHPELVKFKIVGCDDAGHKYPLFLGVND